MTDETPAEKPKPIPENKTREKMESESRRLRGYIAAFKAYADRHTELVSLAREFVYRDPDPSKLPGWLWRFKQELEQLDAAAKDLEAKKV